MLHFCFEVDVDILMSSVDIDGDGEMDFFEFFQMMVINPGKLTRKGEVKGGRLSSAVLTAAANLREYFDLIDTDTGGTIGHDELESFLSSLGEELDPSQWTLIKAMDVDGDGEIDFREFSTLLLDPLGEGLL